MGLLPKVLRGQHNALLPALRPFCVSDLAQYAQPITITPGEGINTPTMQPTG